LRVLVALISVLICGCQKDDCPQYCPIARSHLGLTQATATLVLPAGSEVTLPVTVEGPGQTQPGQCRLFGLDADVLPDNSVNTFLELICKPNELSVVIALIDGGVIEDPRGLVTGDQNLKGKDIGFRWDACSMQGESTASEAAVALSVQEAIGGKASYPTMVTSDYLRRFSASIDTGTITCNGTDPNSNCPVCKQLIRLTLNLAFEQTAADFFIDNQAPCDCY